MRIVWAVGKIGIVKYAWVCVHTPANVSNGGGREEMRKFWNDVNEYWRCFKRGSRIVLIGDTNGRVGCNEIAGVVGKWGVDGINGNGKHLVDLCAELIHRYAWRRRDERGEQKSMIDYIALDERVTKDVLDARVVRSTFDG